MGLLTRLKTGIVLSKDSLGVIRNHPELMAFPLVSGAAGLAFLVVFLGTTFGLIGVSTDGAGLVILFAVYLGTTFISSFFAAGLVHQTRAALRGDDPSLRGGLERAWQARRPLFVWSLISATIGVIINAVENADSRIARIVGALFSVAWTLLTFFIIPVIVFEEQDTRGMFSQSAGTFKQTWGETPISLIGVQVVAWITLLPFILAAFLVASASVLLTVALVLAGLLASFLLSQTLQGVVKTVLYLYATDGAEPEEFDNVDLQGLAGDEPTRSSATEPTSGGVR